MVPSAEEISNNYLTVRQRIAAAAAKAGRDADAVRLVVVTKGQPLEVVRLVVAAGAPILGENYVEEAAAKIAGLGMSPAIEWHMIGHVQSRKAEQVVRHFDLVHSLDSVKLATRLDSFSRAAGRVLAVLLEFNVAGEETKSGWLAPDEDRWPELLSDVSTVLSLANIRVCGLMSIPPLGDSPEDSRPYFRRLARLKVFLGREFGPSAFTDLSIGTSFDYEVAVQEGATMVRVGTAIVGPRAE